MTLAPGTRIGSYEILASLGAGGMGAVYRAKDTRLGRTVAIKAMHDSFAQEPDRIARFEREAQLLASLNHPNIGAIYGVEEAEGSRFLVLEFVDGRTLADLLQAGAPPLPEALVIAQQVAGALAAAHERGIIHRDLKPGNVMVTPDGQVKVLDFGLGKAVEGDSSLSDGPRSNSPTMTMAATQAGIILGTAGYMSPEQAKGRTADKRSDVWAFGCLLFELVTGKRAFDGEDVTEILAAIVRGEPDWTAIPATVSEPIRDLIRRCLIRNRTERIADMSVVQFLLAERSSTMSVKTSDVLVSQTTRSTSTLTLAACFVAGAIVAAAVFLLWPRGGTTAGASGVTRLSIVLPDGDEIGLSNQAPVALTPNGATVVYVGLRDGKTRLFVRSLGSDAIKMLAGTESAKSPFVSPNGQWIGFFADRKLKKVTIDGTALQPLADAPDARGGAWGPDDTIYYAPTNVSGLWQVSAAGGDAKELTPLDRAHGEVSLRWPQVLPDKSVLFSIWEGPGADEHRIARIPASGGDRQILLRLGDTPKYLAPGFLMYGRLDAMFAVPWRLTAGNLGGSVPVTLPETPRLENEGASDYAISETGTLAYVAGSAARLPQRLVWIDRDTAKTETAPLPPRDYENVAVSPDGRQAAVQIQEGLIGIWLWDFARQTMTPFVVTGGSSQAPLWTKDGKTIIYRGTRAGYRNIFMKSADGTGAEERLTTKENVIQTPACMSPDGDWVLYTENGPGQPGTIWKVRIVGDHTPQLVLGAGEVDGQVSPNGHLIAFWSVVDGQSTIFAQPYPGPGPRRQIGRGGAPLWSKDGRELYYENGDQLMAVSIEPTAPFSAGPPKVVATGRYRPNYNSNTQYGLSGDGKRFLRIQAMTPEPPLTRIDVVLNFLEQLKGR